ncbi:acyltransferase family protein [bacterium]|nr:acyltransferase family protein [bacterium]
MQTETVSVHGGKKRLFYIDNIRIFLTILVVLHHTAIGYGGSGDWIIIERPTDSISPVFLTLFNALNQSFFMSLFFLLSGFFVPGALDKKGVPIFIKDRLIRLGIPILVFAFIISKFVDYLILNYTRGRVVTFYQVFSYQFKHPSFNTGPLWFLEALLLFTFVYMSCRLFADRFLKKQIPSPFNNSFPSVRSISISIAAIAFGTYIVRIWFPVGVQVYHFQVGHYVHYIFCFWLGILSYRGKWLDHLTRENSNLWKKTAIVATIVLPLFFVLIMAAGYTIEDCLGGGSWLSFVTATWESVSCLSISIWLLYIFKSRINTQEGWARSMSPNAYTVYIIHQPVVGVVMVFLLGIALPSILKFFIVALVCIPLCFLISHFVFRKIPYGKRVLG